MQPYSKRVRAARPPAARIRESGERSILRPRRAAADAMRLPIAVSDQNQRWRSSSLSPGRRQMRLRIARDDALRDPAMQPILAAIDESARAILPAYCA